ncbi:MAG TPA: proline iminopeptidase-family hydrolase [Cyclobacteriaceae bacterium]|nr:proline iminopeptidase-family hydrolase [Cyclobacteriaceae bacterium]
MKSAILFIALSTFLISCQTELKPHEGFVQVRGGKIWYKVIGDGPGIPLIVMHGGPGGKSCGSIKAFEDFSKDRPVIFFDQLESGKSDHPNDTALWKVPYFVEQVEYLRKHLGLKKFHLLGGSWGASIAVEYMVTQNTDPVASVIFVGPLIGTPQWMEDSKVRISQLSKPVQDTINKYEALRNYTAPAYLAATDSFYAKFLVHSGVRKPNPDCDGIESNRAIYQYMWGPTEFKATGTLRSFNRVPDLNKITKPILFMGGEFDEVLPETLYKYQQIVPAAKVVVIPNAGHASLYDNPEVYLKSLGVFLASVEK